MARTRSSLCRKKDARVHCSCEEDALYRSAKPWGRSAMSRRSYRGEKVATLRSTRRTLRSSATAVQSVALRQEHCRAAQRQESSGVLRSGKDVAANLSAARTSCSAASNLQRSARTRPRCAAERTLERSAQQVLQGTARRWRRCAALRAAAKTSWATANTARCLAPRRGRATPGLARAPQSAPLAQ